MIYRLGTISRPRLKFPKREIVTMLDRWQWERFFCIKSSNFKDTRERISVPLTMGANLRKKCFKLFKNPEKNHSWADLGPRSAWEKLSQMLIYVFVRSGEIPSPGQTSSDKNNDCAMKSERGAPVRGSDPPSGHSVHKTTDDRWRAPARRLIPTYLGAGVQKTGDKNSRSLSAGKK